MIQYKCLRNLQSYGPEIKLLRHRKEMRRTLEKKGKRKKEKKKKKNPAADPTEICKKNKKNKKSVTLDVRVRKSH